MKYWLITYSQDKIVANDVSRKHPADWIRSMMDDFPNTNTILLFAIEITKKQFSALDGEL